MPSWLRLFVPTSKTTLKMIYKHHCLNSYKQVCKCMITDTQVVLLQSSFTVQVSLGMNEAIVSNYMYMDCVNFS